MTLDRAIDVLAKYADAERPIAMDRPIAQAMFDDALAKIDPLPEDLRTAMQVVGRTFDAHYGQIVTRDGDCTLGEGDWRAGCVCGGQASGTAGSGGDARADSVKWFRAHAHPSSLCIGAPMVIRA